MHVLTLPPARSEDVVAVLRDAFHQYPVMRYVLGGSDDYDRHLGLLVRFFVAARVLRDEPVLGIADASGELIAAAMVTLPGHRPPPAELAVRREALWNELGSAARLRYEAYGEAAGRLAVAEPHHHLNMIGVREGHAGRGLGRTLIDAVHELARTHPVSTGVGLNTESASNVSLYQHLGYHLLGRARVGEALETWGLFRPAPSP